MKRLAGEKAAEYVKDGQVVGLGTGTTVYYTLKALAGRDIIGVCTSLETEERCKEFNIPTTSINEKQPELTIDGADQVDPNRCLIKGGGGALTREKIIDYRSGDFIVIVDDKKMVDVLGQGFPLSVEVLPFAWKAVAKDLQKYGNPKLREKDGNPYVTDNQNYIILLEGEFPNPVELEKKLNMIPGVLENGLFTRPVNKVVIGSLEGVKVLE